MGPSASDRRWGNDIGEIEAVGSRVNLLYSAIEQSIRHMLNSELKGSSISATSSKSPTKPEKSSGSKRKDRSVAGPMVVTWNDIFNDTSLATTIPATDGSASGFLGRAEESKYEGTLQESKDDIDINDGANSLGRTDHDNAMAIPQDDGGGGSGGDGGDDNDDNDDNDDSEMDDDDDREDSNDEYHDLGDQGEFMDDDDEDDDADEDDDEDDEDDDDDNHEAMVEGNSEDRISNEENADTAVAAISDVQDTHALAGDTLAIPVTNESSGVEIPYSNSSVTSDVAKGSNSTTEVMNCPPGVEQAVWDALPLAMQIEFLQNLGLDSSGLLEAEISASTMDRDILMALPPELLTQVLTEESTERKRRASFDVSEPPANAAVADAATTNDEMIGPSIDASNNISSSSNNNGSSSSSSDVDNNIINIPEASAVNVSVHSNSSTSTSGDASSLSNENIAFINSLPHDLRQEVMVSAEPEFLASLTPAMQTEARRIRSMYGIFTYAPARPASSSSGSGADVNNSTSSGMQATSTTSATNADQAENAPQAAEPAGTVATTSTSAGNQRGTREDFNSLSLSQAFGALGANSNQRMTNPMFLINEIFGSGSDDVPSRSRPGGTTRPTIRATNRSRSAARNAAETRGTLAY